MNDELHQLFIADQQERENHPEVGAQLTVENNGKMPPLEDAPEWLKQALARWKK